MGRLFLINLEGDFYSCKHCRTHFALEDDVISMLQNSNNFLLFLCNDSVNVTFGEKEERMMLSGLKTVVDIFCVACGSILGWRYEVVHEQNQKYKEGKFILEMFKVLGPADNLFLAVQEALAAGSDADD
ncbi:hypothetical protein JHK82_051076 [Glycine max]|nr:hypothetical protein JHK86_050927 [Glycine max]KAG4925240.1 hypothetical protein JHK87_050780 [Glycine soja]KAG4936856.1 hypothetical protein JHK85_051775 [Glycine max]KAG5092298.1 hypothetical protein JHK82_051076 [Glycine max]KAG5095376.1 hypothetical protein JHK84_050964 [Glycine max]